MKHKLAHKWARRSDTVLMLMLILWFIGAIWGMTIVTVQVFRDSYSIDIGSVLTYIGAPVSGYIITWLIKNLTENNIRTKSNPDYKEPVQPGESDTV